MVLTMIQGSTAIALACTIWSLFVTGVQCVGLFKLFTSHAAPPPKPISSTRQEDEIPHLTLIRPAKGIEPGFYECLASSFRQDYPRGKLTICLCVSSTSDIAYPVLKQILADFPGFDANILVEEEDPVLNGTGGEGDRLGPNPKIRNMSRAYREARDGVVWIVDSNIWLSKGVAGRMVDKLYGFRSDGQRNKPYKLVHQTPLVIDIGGSQAEEAQGLLHGGLDLSSVPANGGSSLEEMFMTTTHAKFYIAINTIGVAPCTVGKSCMFRKAHLDLATDPARNPILRASDASRGRGIDFFSCNICEDHLIGDLLWRTKIPGFQRHALAFGDLAIQPISGMSVAAYAARRVRWLRVRKWTVTLATLVEPGIESLLCSAYFAYGFTTLPWFHDVLGVPQTWSAMATTWLTSVTIWACVDNILYHKLHRCQSVEVDEATPIFARGIDQPGGMPRKTFGEWLAAWLGRECLALPIWTWAVLLGATFTWRGKSFKVRPDMTVVEIDGEKKPSHEARGEKISRSRSKDRVD